MNGDERLTFLYPLTCKDHVPDGGGMNGARAWNTGGTGGTRDTGGAQAGHRKETTNNGQWHWMTKF